MPKKPYQILITCEHATDFIPRIYRDLFPLYILKTHRAIDFGAKTLAQQLSKKLKVPAYYAKHSRLLVDLNRSLDNKRYLFKSPMRDFSMAQKELILKKYYYPYRNTIEEDIVRMLKNDVPVLHLSIHSFAPILNGKRRTNDVGLLFDPQHKREKEFCLALKKDLQRRLPKMAHRFNVPYKGTSDGFTTWLRKRYKAKPYIGIEIEINQKYPLQSPSQWHLLRHEFCESLQTLTNFQQA